nr:hypothetical protein [Arthrospira sp. PLM2.Bin9]
MLRTRPQAIALFHKKAAGECDRTPKTATGEKAIALFHKKAAGECDRTLQQEARVKRRSLSTGRRRGNAIAFNRKAAGECDRTLQQEARVKRRSLSSTKRRLGNAIALSNRKPE